MTTTAKPIIATTSLSLLLHAVVLAGLVLIYKQSTPAVEGVGSGVEIQLISSVLVSDQSEVEMPRKAEVITDSVSQRTHKAAEKRFTEIKVSSRAEDAAVATDAKAVVEQQGLNQQEQTASSESESAADIRQSTSASQQQHAILELLHSRISDNKEYPYIARRQRREGVATVGFVLHPDGSIENPQLVTSSSAGILDRAALTAVRRIAPFTPAKDYLEHAETFKVDVVFNLM